jgi:hypothetical protein
MSLTTEDLLAQEEMENDELRAQVAALTKERDKYRKQVVLGFKHLMETPVITDTEIEEGYTAFEHLRLALVKALNERDWFNHKSKCLEMERVSQEEYITAAQAQVARLREALETISDEENWGEDGCWESSSYPDEIANEALAIPTDTAALDARLAQERERCAVVAEKSEWIAAQIRSMK